MDIMTAFAAIAALAALSTTSEANAIVALAAKATTAAPSNTATTEAPFKLTPNLVVVFTQHCLACFVTPLIVLDETTVRNTNISIAYIELEKRWTTKATEAASVALDTEPSLTPIALSALIDARILENQSKTGAEGQRLHQSSIQAVVMQETTMKRRQLEPVLHHPPT
jgi:hypothetical protein